jgi:hypothetical protein
MPHLPRFPTAVQTVRPRIDIDGQLSRLSAVSGLAGQANPADSHYRCSGCEGAGQLEDETRRVKQLVAEQTLDI